MLMWAFMNETHVWLYILSWTKMRIDAWNKSLFYWNVMGRVEKKRLHSGRSSKKNYLQAAWTYHRT